MQILFALAKKLDFKISGRCCCAPKQFQLSPSWKTGMFYSLFLAGRDSQGRSVFSGRLQFVVDLSDYFLSKLPAKTDNELLK